MTDPDPTYPGPRITAAREFLEYVRRWKVTEVPPTVLQRECAELRRQLGLVLDDTTRSRAQQAALVQALDDAARYRLGRVPDGCADCAASAAGCCPAHASEREQAGRYRELAGQLRAAPVHDGRQVAVLAG
jgi:hypothetical protein